MYEPSFYDKLWYASTTYLQPWGSATQHVTTNRPNHWGWANGLKERLSNSSGPTCVMALVMQLSAASRFMHSQHGYP